MPTLSELTETLSQAITLNERERTAALAALEGERTTTLAALPGAAALLRRHAEAIAEAEAERDATRLDVEADLAEAERLTASRRRAEEDDAERRLRDADDAAERTRRTAEEKAIAAFEAAAVAIEKRDLSPGEEVLARAEARRAMDRARDAAQDAFTTARLANQDRLLDDRRAAVEDALNESRENRAKAAARRHAADLVFGQSVEVSDRLLQAGLAAVTGVPALIAEFDARRRSLERRFRAQEAALFAEFRKAREALEGTSEAERTSGPSHRGA